MVCPKWRAAACRGQPDSKASLRKQKLPSTSPAILDDPAETRLTPSPPNPRRCQFRLLPCPARARLLRRCYGCSRTKKKRPNPSKDAQRIRALHWSGRLDLNQRPLAPQGPRCDFAPIARESTRAQTGVSTALVLAPEPLAVASIAPERGERTAPELRPADSAWLTPAQVGARLQVCRATVYKLCAKGELGYVRVGLAVRIAPSDLDAFLSTKREGGR